MKRIKTVSVKGRGFKLTVKVEAVTTRLMRDEADEVISYMADEAMRSLVGVRYFHVNLSKIKVK